MNTISENLKAEFEQCVDAIVNGNLETLKQHIIQHPELVHTRSTLNHHATLLFYVTANAVENERQKTPDNILEITRFLLENGADPNVTLDAYGGNPTLLGLLVSSSHPAHANKQADLVKLLCQQGANPNINDNSPIKTAIAFRYPEAIQALVDSGASLDHVVFAAAVGDLEQVKTFIKAGVQPITTAFGVVLDDSQAILEFACISASMMGHIDVVTYLLTQGIDINARQSAEGGTALHEASITGQGAIVKLLLESGADITIQDKHDNTPLHLAAWHQHHRVMNMLLDNQASLETLNTYDATVLDFAVYGAIHGYYPTQDPIGTLKKLLDAGADVEAVSPYPTGNQAIDDLLKSYK